MAEDQTNPETSEPAADTAVDESRMTATEADGRAQAWREKVAAPLEHTPTPEEAREMFAQNPGLWAVLTTEGNKLRGEC